MSKDTAVSMQIPKMPSTNKRYDYLGNVRVSFGRNSAGALELVDVNDYYPFGMNHLKSEASFFGVSSYKNYKYNGKELQETGMYDYWARFYMPDIMQTPQIDTLAEKMQEWSPYSYAFIILSEIMIQPEWNQRMLLMVVAMTEVLNNVVVLFLVA